MLTLKDGWYLTKDKFDNEFVGQIYTTETGEKRIVWTHKNTSWRHDDNLYHFCNTQCPTFHLMGKVAGEPLEEVKT